MDFFALSLGKALATPRRRSSTRRGVRTISHAPDRVRFATPARCRARVQCEPAWDAALKPPRIPHGVPDGPRRSQSAANTMGIFLSNEKARTARGEPGKRRPVGKVPLRPTARRSMARSGRQRMVAIVAS